MNWRENKQWSDAYMPAVRGIVGPLLLVDAPLELDTKEATDLVVLRARDMRIGVRVRREGYAERFPNQFTIRCKLDNGAPTELRKIIDGWGDWLFYGHAHGEFDIRPWWVIDLSAFRAQLIRNPKDIRRGMTPNGDGTHFAWFDLTSFADEPPICISQYTGHVSQRAA